MWHGIEGHDDVVERFRRALARGRLASSFLFAGPSGIGKRAFAMTLAQALLCQTRPEQAMDPCGACPSCAQVTAGTHPDVERVAKPEGKSDIPLALLIGDDEHRRREGLCHNIALKPYLGGRKVAVIDDADDLNEEGATALLKTLEEPPPRSVLILIGTTPAKQLPTIRSRCQLIRFRPLPPESVASLLVSKGYVADTAEARRLAELGEGSVGRALELADPAFRAFRNTLVEHLCRPVLEPLPLAQTVTAFVDAAGKEAPARRARLRQAVAFAAEYYRQLLHAQCGGPPSGDRQDVGCVQRTIHPQPAVRFPHPTDFEPGPEGAEATATRLERCLAAAAQVDRNANQSTLIECWLDDLAAGRGWGLGIRD
jgi:DNA polymerase-3 subunit delta'